MKIRLTKDVPVDKKHGLTAGKILDVIKRDDEDRDGTWVVGDTGQKVRILAHEYEIESL